MFHDNTSLRDGRWQTSLRSGCRWTSTVCRWTLTGCRWTLIGCRWTVNEYTINLERGMEVLHLCTDTPVNWEQRMLDMLHILASLHSITYSTITILHNHNIKLKSCFLAPLKTKYARCGPQASSWSLAEKLIPKQVIVVTAKVVIAIWTDPGFQILWGKAYYQEIGSKV